MSDILKVQFTDKRVRLALDKLLVLEQERADDAGISITITPATFFTGMIKMALKRHNLSLSDFTPPTLPVRLVPVKPRAALLAAPPEDPVELVKTLKTLVGMLTDDHNLSQAAIVRECGFKNSSISRLSSALGGYRPTSEVRLWIDNCRALLAKKNGSPEPTLPALQRAPKSAAPAPAPSPASDDQGDDDDDDAIDADNLLDGPDDDDPDDDGNEIPDDDDGSDDGEGVDGAP